MSPPTAYYPSYPGQSTWYPTAAIDVLSAFSVDKWRGEIGQAQRSSMLKRIVKKTIVNQEEVPTKYRTPKGKPIKVEPFPFFAPTSRLLEYSAPVAVNLYLNFQFECALLFVVMCALRPHVLAHARVPALPVASSQRTLCTGLYSRCRSSSVIFYVRVCAMAAARGRIQPPITMRSLT